MIWNVDNENRKYEINDTFEGWIECDLDTNLNHFPYSHVSYNIYYIYVIHRNCLHTIVLAVCSIVRGGMTEQQQRDSQRQTYKFQTNDEKKF